MTRRALMLVLAFASAGCGQTGELFLPEDAPPAPITGPTSATPGKDDTTANDDDEEDEETPAR